MIPERKTKYPTENSRGCWSPNQQLQEKEQLETAPQISYNLPVWGFQPSKRGSVLLKGYLMGGK